MGERRLDMSAGPDSEARIKQIAGLIRSLPYRDMRKFAEELRGEFATHIQHDVEVAEALLAWAESKVAA